MHKINFRILHSYSVVLTYNCWEMKEISFQTSFTRVMCKDTEFLRKSILNALGKKQT